MSPWPRSLFGLRRRQLFNIYLLVGSIGIVVAVTWFTVNVSRKVEHQTQVATQAFANMASRIWGTGIDREMAEVIKVLVESEVPFILTENSGHPVYWNQKLLKIRIPDDLQELRSQDLGAPGNPDVARLLLLKEQYDHKYEPYAVMDPETGRRMGTLHHGPTELSQVVKVMPYLELLLLAIFFLLIMWGLKLKQDGEQQRLFAGMAKETAHQLGTPITSIMGWQELLREKVGRDDYVVNELDQDIRRLEKISARFSQIGSRPRLQEWDLEGVVAGAISYMERRLPHLGGRVELRSQGAVGNRCRFNRELLEWVLENLIKNGIDALKDGKGTITVELADGADGGVSIRVSDTGVGLPPGRGNRIFEPGYTTKKRGWGMGLALVKRIVTQYHGGTIQVEQTGPRGTTFAITLPQEEPNRAVQDPVG